LTNGKRAAAGAFAVTVQPLAIRPYKELERLQNISVLCFFSQKVNLFFTNLFFQGLDELEKTQ
jgi:hypothetical protein